MRTPADLLGSDNYFHWEFNMRMKLARKGLLAHIIHEAKEHEMTDAWRVPDLKAFAIIAQGIEVEHQSKIRNATTAKQAWDVLRDYYNKGNIQNRITLTRKLHEFKMEEGSSMSNHLDRFGELVVAMEAVGDRLDESRQLVILLGSLPAVYDTIVTVIENAHNVSLDEVKEKLLKQYDKLQQQEPAEGAFRARHRGGRNGRTYNNNNNRREGNSEKKNWRQNKFQVTCYGCGKRGHKKHECRSKQDGDEAMFMAHATSEPEADGNWLIDSGASSHMSPYRDDFVTYQKLKKPIEVKVADGKKVTAAGRARLLSVPKLTDRGWVTQFTANECSIMKGKRVVARAPLVGNSYVLRGHREKAMLVEYKEADSEWELYHARHGHAGHEVYKNTQRATTGLPEIKKSSSHLCGGCATGKMTVATFPTESTTKTTHWTRTQHDPPYDPTHPKNDQSSKPDPQRPLQAHPPSRKHDGRPPCQLRDGLTLPQLVHQRLD